MNEQDIKGLRLVADFSLLFQKMRAIEKDISEFIYHRDPQNLIKTIEESDRQGRRLIDQYGKMELAEDDRRLFAEIKKELEKYLQVRNQIIKGLGGKKRRKGKAR